MTLEVFFRFQNPHQHWRRFWLTSSTDPTEEVTVPFLDKTIYHFSKWIISDLAVDLAYALSKRFGEQFESWQKANQTSNPSTKVDLLSQFV